jgi:hypothetical protein
MDTTRTRTESEARFWAGLTVLLGIAAALELVAMGLVHV